MRMESPRAHPDRQAPSPAEVEAVLRENDSLVRVVFEAGRAAYPTLPLPYGSFATRLVEIVHRRPMGDLADTSPGQFARRLARVAGEEIFLAIACEERVPGAWEAFNASHAENLKQAAARHCGPGTDSEALAVGLFGDLFSPPEEGGARTRIGTWDGSAPLGAWLLGVLRLRVRDARRAAEAKSRASGSEQARSEVEGELKAAWGSLTPTEMLALTLTFRDGRSPAEIAGLLGVEEARVDRLVRSAAGKLRDRLGVPNPTPAAE